MEFNCSKEELVRGIHIVEKAVAVRNTLPIIGNILLESTSKGIKLAANDLEIGIEAIVDSQVLKDGAILAPAKTFSGIIQRLPEGEVKIKIDEGNTIKISCAQSKFTIHGLPTDEFPMLPKIKDGHEFEVPALLLRDIIKQTIIAVSMDESKHVLNGVLLDINDKELICVSTDGYRLAQRKATLEHKVNFKGSVIIPTKVLTELLRVLQQESYTDAVRVSFSKEQISFSFKDIYFVSRLIQGQFPDYKQVIPKKTEVQMTIPRTALQEAAERSSIIASTSANIIRLETMDNKLHITANTPDVGNVSELLDVIIKGAEKNKVAFNVRLLLDVLRNIEDEDIILELTGTLSPGIVRSPSTSDYLYIIMPIRTAE